MATVRRQLLNPEIGWKRIEHTDPNISFSKNWSLSNQSAASAGSDIRTRTAGETIKFNIKGSSGFKIIAPINNDLSNAIGIKINDREEVTYSIYNGSIMWEVVVFEGEINKGQENSIVITTKNTSLNILDSIDIEEGGSILPYSPKSDKYYKTLVKSNEKIYSLKSTETLHQTRMTSDVLPAPFKASASTVYASTYAAFKAFNGTVSDQADGWVANKSTGWIQIDYGSLKKVNHVEITMRNTTTLDSAPKDFEVWGSKDNNVFELLAEVKEETNWLSSEKRKFLLSHIGKYQQLKIVVTANNGNATQLTIGDIAFGYTHALTEVPDTTEETFIEYGGPIDIEGFDIIQNTKDYILHKTTDGIPIQKQLTQKVRKIYLPMEVK